MTFFTNLRDLLVQDMINTTRPEDISQLPPGTVRCRQDSDVVVYEKEPNVPVFIIDGGGEAIQCVQAPKRVLVPLVAYHGDEAEPAVQERIAALIEACGLGFSEKRHPHVELAKAIDHLRTDLRHPLMAVMANQDVADKLVGLDAEVKIYVSPLTLTQGMAFGISLPEYVGHMAISPFRGQGLLVHGQVTTVRIETGATPKLSRGTPRPVPVERLH